MNASSLKRESKKLTFVSSNNVAFGRVNDQFQAVAQEPADTIKDTLARTRSVYQYSKVIRVASKLVASFLKFFVQRIEHNVRQKRR